MFLQASRLAVGYSGVPVLPSITFELELGDVLAVVGHNGSGKSTFVKTLLGVIPAVSGTFEWPNSKPKKIAYLGQRTEFDVRFPIRVRDLVAMGAWPDLGLHLRLGQTAYERIEDAMRRTAISQIADQPLHVLSAGQLQRALFARTIMQDAPLILLDEPFTAIDQTTESHLLELIDTWTAESRTIVLVLHDLSAVLQHCNKALLFGDGRARFGYPRDVLSPTNLVDQGYLSSSQAAWFEAMYAVEVDRVDHPSDSEGGTHV